MKAFLIALLLWQIADAAPPSPNPEYFRYQRAITLFAHPTAAASAVPACATLDGSIYAHGAPSLKDVRLYEGTREVPYAITLSESAESDSEPAKLLSPGMQNGHLVFLLEMPARPYTDVTLDLNAHDFIASATVQGMEDADPPALVKLGTYTLFDLTAQHLSRSTTLHLQESNFPKLRIDLDLTPAPGAAPFATTPNMIVGAAVPPSREAQTLYTSVAETSAITQRGRQTVARFRLPAHVPVERVTFALAPEFAENFSRNVQITGHTEGEPATAIETLTGSIQRVRINKGTPREIHQQQLSVPATLGANLQHDADVEVLIDNGDDTPLPISAIKLEMRERRICFNIPAAPLTLDYGDPALEAPVYDFARTLSLTSTPAPAKLAAEQPNPTYRARPAPLRPLTERHPELLWIVLLGVVCILAVVAIHSSKRLPK
jgi:hypothetical protein